MIADHTPIRKGEGVGKADDFSRGFFRYDKSKQMLIKG